MSDIPPLRVYPSTSLEDKDAKISALEKKLAAIEKRSGINSYLVSFVP